MILSNRCLKAYKKHTNTIDVEVWLPVMKVLIKKYGNFKVSPDLYNLIIYNLCEICDAIEASKIKDDK